MPRAESNNTEQPTPRFKVEINPVKMKEIINNELQVKAVAAINDRKKTIAKTVFTDEEV